MAVVEAGMIVRVRGLRGRGDPLECFEICCLSRILRCE